MPLEMSCLKRRIFSILNPNTIVTGMGGGDGYYLNCRHIFINIFLSDLTFTKIFSKLVFLKPFITIRFINF